MDSEFWKMILGLGLRHGAGALGGWLAINGYVDSAGEKQFEGAVILFGAIAWSIWQKKGHAAVLAWGAKFAGVSVADVKAKAQAAVFLLATLTVLALMADSRSAFAADVVTKEQPQSVLVSSLANGYPQQGGGFYYGIDTEAASGTLNTTAVNATAIQGDLGFVLGYALNLSKDGSSFVFAEGLFNISNLNAPGASGLSASGPAHFEQRFAFGGPLTTFIGSFSTLSSIKNAIPSLPGLPAGVTSGPQWPYLFASIHEQDVSFKYGLANGREWLVSPGFGVGMLSRLSNNVVMDVWAEAKLDSNSMAIGPAASGKLGNGFVVGFALKY